ncbi:MAG: TrkH family potassium uptake protein [Firmicutes bacterium]|nr:TrkH family potassium uptake protein [Bacillota bacterium]
MNYKMVLKSLGVLLISEAAAMSISLIVAFIYKDEGISAFIYTIFILLLVGFPLTRLKPHSSNLYAKDGFAIVAFGWIAMSVLGALPYYFSGMTSTFIDSFFEAVSGFTTTRASVLSTVENLPNSIMFWNGLTHWMGGMGVLILTLAILPTVSATSLYIMKAESPGPKPGKLVPKMGQTAKILYGIYLIITMVLVILLITAGMPVFDSLIHAFGTVSTGGISNRNLSIGAYNSIFIEIIITFFMLICGMSFTLHYQVFKGNIGALFKNEEFKFYITVIGASILLISINLYGSVFASIGESLRHSSFQVVSIISTTGFSSTDFDKWPMLSKSILFFLMFMGGCAGSTGGGIKNIRVLLLLKSAKSQLMKIIHPRGIYPVRLDGRIIDDKSVAEIMSFFFLYIFIFVIGVIFVSFDGYDFTTTLTSVAATMGNTGYGLSMVGPMGNYSIMSPLSKIVLSFAMLIGRLEIYPILLLTVPTFWKKD